MNYELVKTKVRYRVCDSVRVSTKVRYSVCDSVRVGVRTRVWNIVASHLHASEVNNEL